MIQMYLLFVLFLLVVGASFVAPTQNGGIDQSLEKKSTDVVKGVFIIGIMISHIATHSQVELSNYIQKLVYYFETFLGTAGVGVFFFFSGYGNYQSLKKKKTRKEWLMWLTRYLCRVLITLFVCLVFCEIYLISTGKGLSIGELFLSFITLTMPYTTTWYLKIQVLLYVFILISFLIAKGGARILVTIVASTVYIVIAVAVGARNFWWNMTICFPLGMMAAEKKDIVDKIESMLKRRKILVVACGILLVLCYFSNIVIDSARFPIIVVVLSTCLTALMILFFDSLKPLNIVLNFVGKYSFELYLIHITLVSVIFIEGTTAIKMVIYFAISFVMGFIAHHLIIYIMRFLRLSK